MYSAYDDERDPFEDEGDPREDGGVTCERCGEEGLSWFHTGVRWRLVDEYGPHTCKPNADDFEDLI